jgi:hypothetical protein
MMLRRALTIVLVMVGALLGNTIARGEGDPKAAQKFFDGLRERGYYDLASEYLEELRNDPSTPAETRATVDFEQGRLLFEEAARTGDLVRQRELLDQAGTKLAEFIAKNPNHPKTATALVQRAALFVERGHLAQIQGIELEDKEKAEKAAKLNDARASFDEARKEYAKAVEQLTAAFKKFPNFIPEGNPQKAIRDDVHTSLMTAKLQKAVVDYEQGQTYEPNTKERHDYMSAALAQFEQLYKEYRTMLTGQFARMWQAKCYEERGEIGPALGIYKELLQHEDPHLRNLQKHVAYFKIIAEAKRGEHALAADDAARWTQEFPTPSDRRSNIGLGVRLQWAKNLLAQMDKAANDAERKALIARAVELASEVVRISSQHKPEALAILKKYKPSRAAAVAEVARLNYEDAIKQAEEAMGEKDFNAAIACFKQAIRRADPAKDPDRANLARFQLAFCYLKTDRPYEAFVLYDHIARRYPRNGLASKSGHNGLMALVDAYRTYTQIDHGSDLMALIDLADYTASTWPGTEAGDTALLLLGQINDGLGKYPKAIAAYDAINAQSPKWIEAKWKAGNSHWAQSEALRKKGSSEAAAAEAEVVKATDSLNQSLKARRDAGITNTDAALIINACDIADIYLFRNKPADALALLDPIAKANATPVDTPAFGRLMATLLQAHVDNDQIQLALADMESLEKAGGGDAQKTTNLYVKLGQRLEQKLEDQKAKGDTAAHKRTREAYLKLLTTMAERKSQTYSSLRWVGENLLKIGEPQGAKAVFNQYLERAGKDPSFLSQPNANPVLYGIKLRLAAAETQSGDYSAADNRIADLIQENPKAIEAQIEKGMLLESKALAGKGPWAPSLAQWNFIANRLRNARTSTKSTEYYDAYWHLAFGYWKEGKPLLAKQTLASVMRLSPGVGGPAMKKKYVDLLAQIK